MKKLTLFLLILLGLTTTQVLAQNQMVMYNMHRSLPQANYLNPAFVPHFKVNIGLPGISSNQFAFTNGQLAFRDIFHYEGDSLIFINSDDDEDVFLGKLDEVNNIDMTGDITLLYVGIGTEKSFVSVSVREKYFSTFNYTRDLVGWLLKGPGSEGFSDRPLNVSDLYLEATAYSEIAVGYSFKVANKLQLGARLKLLQGQYNFHTAELEAGLYSGQDSAAISVESLLINTTGFDLNDGVIADPADVLGKFGNSGIGFSVGAELDVNDRLSVNGAINYQGSINWKENTRAYELQGANYSFTGFDALELISKNDTSSEFLTQEQEEFKAAFDLTETANVTYTSRLPTTAYIGASYEIIKGHHAGAVLHGALIEGNFRPAVNLSYNLHVKKFLNFSLSANMIEGQLNNIGTGLTLNGGPLQIYFITDNIMSWFYPARAKVADARVGLNLTFGREK